MNIHDHSLVLQYPARRCLGTQNPFQNNLQKGLEHKGLASNKPPVSYWCYPMDQRYQNRWLNSPKLFQYRVVMRHEYMRAASNLNQECSLIISTSCLVLFHPNLNGEVLISLLGKTRNISWKKESWPSASNGNSLSKRSRSLESQVQVDGFQPIWNWIIFP